MRRGGVRFRGSITVFLCLMLVCVMGFTGACLEYARAQTVSCQVQLAADSAAESIFAGYHDPLFDTYQVLGRLIPGGNYEALEKETLRYAGAYGGPRSPGDRGGMASFRAVSADWTEVALLTDQNGSVFTHMAAEAMMAEGVSVLADQWKARLGLSDGESAGTLSQNAGKESWNLSDILQGYDGWSGRVQAAEKEAAEKAEEAAAAAAARGEVSDTPVRPDGPGAEGTRVLNIIETMKALMKNGPLELVIPKGKEISRGTISSGGLPSGMSASAKARTAAGRSVSGGNTLLFHEYLMRHMDCFTGDCEKSVAYELEYLAAGRQGDRENLQAVVTRLLWMRIGMNILYLNTSPARKLQAREAATAAVGWTGQIPLIEVTTQLLISAWAAAESLVDVRTLLSGEKVPLKKTDLTWKLSLEHMADGGKSTQMGVALSPEEKGLSYVDYLRILMYLMSDQTLAYRAMDVIQWNMKKIDPDFAMRNCMTAGKMTLNAGTSPMFVVLYRRIGGMGQGRDAGFRKVSSYSYL